MYIDSFHDNNGNTLTITDKNGNIIPITEYPNLNVVFKGSNSKIIIVNPMRIRKFMISCGNNCKISLGNNCDIYGELYIFATANNSSIKIGENCSFAGVRIMMQNEPNLSIDIGNTCLFAQDISIRSSDSHTIFDIDTKRPINIPHKISIGNHVWIGNSVDILKNSSIPNNCIIGIRSIVNKIYHDENCVLAGIPAKVVKKNINWNWKTTYEYLKDHP